MCWSPGHQIHLPLWISIYKMSFIMALHWNPLWLLLSLGQHSVSYESPHNPSLIWQPHPFHTHPMCCPNEGLMFLKISTSSWVFPPSQIWVSQAIWSANPPSLCPEPDVELWSSHNPWEFVSHMILFLESHQCDLTQKRSHWKAQSCIYMHLHILICS